MTTSFDVISHIFKNPFKSLTCSYHKKVQCIHFPFIYDLFGFVEIQNAYIEIIILNLVKFDCNFGILNYAKAMMFLLFPNF